MKIQAVVSVAGILFLGACANVSVGVGVGGTSGNVGVGAGVSTSVGGDNARTAGSQLTVTMYKIDANGVGPEIGTLMFADTRSGLRIEAALGSLPPGEHGFHVHEKPDCGAALKDGVMTPGLAAGPHLDPAKTGKHMGPDGAGHEGDLPVLKVDAEGNATDVLIAPHLTVEELRGRAIMIHEGGDNYSDQPKPLGGGGARIACGVVK